MHNPYSSLPARAFWRTAVAERSAFQIAELWDPKAPISRGSRIVTFGSCFAQHIGQAFKVRGYGWYDAEPGPKLISDKLRRDYNYGIFSARTANVYTARALVQWIRYALGHEVPPAEIWTREDRFYDPLRPSIEPNGFLSPDELHASRETTLKALKEVCESCDLFVFTLGLTEGWINRGTGLVYAVCPGTLAGEFDPALHQFHNFDVMEVLTDMREAIRLVTSINPAVRFLLTVSPVPLTATASGDHVLVSTTYSKSVLRAAAGQLAAEVAGVDYFPSYEIIVSPPFRGMFFEPNARSVAMDGVNFVMTSFFDCLARKFTEAPALLQSTSCAAPDGRGNGDDEEDLNENQVICEEQMLGKYAPT